MGDSKKCETLEEAAIREVSEEIHSGFTINEKNLVKLLAFIEQAASDLAKKIRMTVFLCNKKIDVPLIINEEILEYH